MKTDKQKAEEILRKRKLAAEGLEEKPDNPLEDPIEKKEEEEKIDDAALSTDLGLHR